MKKQRIFGAALGCLTLSILIWSIRLFDILSQPRKLGLAFLAVAIAGGIRLWVQTAAWQLALRAEGIDVSHWRLVAVRLASQATGYLAALGPAVSEPTKLMLLKNPSGMAAAAPATLVETGMYWFTTVIVGLGGTIAASFLISNAPVLWASAGVFGVSLAFLNTRRPLLSRIARWMNSRTPKWLVSAAKAEEQIRSYRERRPEAASTIFQLECVAQLLTLAEVAAVLWVLGIRFSVLQVLIIEAAGRLVKILGAWIPGRIGADEAGSSASFAVVGLMPAAGLTLALARRLRDLLWCAIGIMWMASAAPALSTRSEDETDIRLPEERMLCKS